VDGPAHLLVASITQRQRAADEERYAALANGVNVLDKQLQASEEGKHGKGGLTVRGLSLAQSHGWKCAIFMSSSAVVPVPVPPPPLLSPLIFCCVPAAAERLHRNGHSLTSEWQHHTATKERQRAAEERHNRAVLDTMHSSTKKHEQEEQEQRRRRREEQKRYQFDLDQQVKALRQRSIDSLTSKYAFLGSVSLHREKRVCSHAGGGPLVMPAWLPSNPPPAGALSLPPLPSSLQQFIWLTC
jgi:hypothetical protein